VVVVDLAEIQEQTQQELLQVVKAEITAALVEIMEVVVLEVEQSE
jgi:hypothetical protein